MLAPNTDSFEFPCSIMVSSKQSGSGTKCPPIPAATPHVLLFSSGAGIAVHTQGAQLGSSGLKQGPPSFLSFSFSLHKWKKKKKSVLSFLSLAWLILPWEGGGSMSLFPQATQASHCLSGQKICLGYHQDRPGAPQQTGLPLAY